MAYPLPRWGVLTFNSSYTRSYDGRSIQYSKVEDIFTESYPKKTYTGPQMAQRRSPTAAFRSGAKVANGFMSSYVVIPSM